MFLRLLSTHQKHVKGNENLSLMQSRWWKAIFWGSLSNLQKKKKNCLLYLSFNFLRVLGPTESNFKITESAVKHISKMFCLDFLLSN